MWRIEQNLSTAKYAQIVCKFHCFWDHYVTGNLFTLEILLLDTCKTDSWLH